MNKPHDKNEDNAKLFLEFLESFKKRRTTVIKDDPNMVPYYRLPVQVVEHMLEEYNANLRRMTKEEREAHYHKNPKTFYNLCPDGKEHHSIGDPSEPSYMCDTAYICVNCGWTHRVDSSD
jgi:hypothetical protein